MSDLKVNAHDHQHISGGVVGLCLAHPTSDHGKGNREIERIECCFVLDNVAPSVSREVRLIELLAVLPVFGELGDVQVDTECICKLANLGLDCCLQE